MYSLLAGTIRSFHVNKRFIAVSSTKQARILILGESPIKPLIVQHLRDSYGRRFNIATEIINGYNYNDYFHVVLFNLGRTDPKIMFSEFVSYELLMRHAHPRTFGLITVPHEFLQDTTLYKYTETLLADLCHNERNTIAFGYDYIRYTQENTAIGSDLIRVSRTIKRIIKTFE